LQIVFLGLKNSFDFYHIGGMDSLVRRLALGLAELGNQVEFVHYDADQEKTEQNCHRITIHHFRKFNDALKHLVASECDHVVSIYLRPRDRLNYACFRRTHRGSIRFHCICSCWHEVRFRRELFFAEARLFPFNGTLFCVSPRIYRYVSQWASQAALLLPPVPESYFCRPEEKRGNNKLRLTYAGRVDPGKGTERAVEVFERLGARKDVEARLCGFAWSHRKETVELHERLLANPNIRYEPVEYKGWSPEVDENFCRLLRGADILLLPYEKLSSTVDTPLLLLEGMASLCAIITPHLGDLHATYGPSEFNLSEGWDTDAAIELIHRMRESLSAERERLDRRNQNLAFNTSSTVELFGEHLRVSK